MTPETTPRYMVKCDDCHETMRHTDDVRESAAGGVCDSCHSQRTRGEQILNMAASLNGSATPIADQIERELQQAAVKATLTMTTCSIACWLAREPECSCSCGGKSHGIMLQDGSEQPRRNCMIQGYRYVLAGVDSGRPIDRLDFDWRRSLDAETRATFGRHKIYRNEAASLVWIKKASAAQLEKWPEVAQWAAANLEQRRTAYAEAIAAGRRPYGGEPSDLRRPYLLWVRADAADSFDTFQSAQ